MSFRNLEMTKTDFSLHKKCIDKINRSTITPYDFKWTEFFETKEEFETKYRGMITNFDSDEIPICSTIIDLNNWSILTTRRIITNFNSKISEGQLDKASDKLYGEFKDFANDGWTLGRIELRDGKEQAYFIETGRASMIMIQGVRTLIKLKS